MKSIKKIVLIILCCLVAACLITVGYYAWAYTHPDLRICKLAPYDMEKEEPKTETIHYVEGYSVDGGARVEIKNLPELPEKIEKRVAEMNSKLGEEFNSLLENYEAPKHIEADCRFEDGKTVFTFKGDAIDKTSGEKITINDVIEFDYIVTKKIEN